MSKRYFAIFATLLSSSAIAAETDELTHDTKTVAHIASEITYSIERILRQPEILTSDELIDALISNRNINCNRTTQSNNTLSCEADLPTPKYHIKILRPFASGDGEIREYARIELLFKSPPAVSIEALRRALPEWQTIDLNRCNYAIWRKSSIKNSKTAMTIHSADCDLRLSHITLNTGWAPHDFPAPIVK